MREGKRKCVKCGSSPDNDPDTKLYRFPRPGSTNTDRCELWAKYCYPDEPWSSADFHNQLHNQHRMLCHRHFKESAFVDYPTKKLRKFASPDAEEIIMPFLESQNTKPDAEVPQPLLEIIIEAPPAVPGPSGLRQKPVLILKQNKKLEFQKCKVYLNKIATLRKTLGQMKNKELLHNLLILSKNISPSFVNLLQSQIKNCKKSPTVRRWTTQEKLTALKLYIKSPDCYRLFRRNFPIPLPSSLKALLRMCVLEDGINMHIFKIIGKFALRLKPINNEFVLLFNEMALRKNEDFNHQDYNIENCQDNGESQLVSYALVFMIAGITKKIKQPVAYYLSDSSVTANRLATLIKEILRQCYDHGINISATVCDTKSVNWRALNILGATISSPYFTYDNHEVVALIDPPHLIKCFRNQFLEYDIEWPIDISNETAGTGIAKWSHIVQFYEIDNANPNNAFAPLLKLEHLNPNSEQKKRVDLAVQVLSHSVSSGMYARIGKGLPVSAIVTADLIFKMDKIIDTLNSDTLDLRRGKPFSTNLRDSTPHFTLINDMKKRLLSLKFVGAKQTSSSQMEWIVTLNGIERLWHTLRQRHPLLRSIATRRLQLDPLENLFASIRANFDSNCEPTTAQFVDALKMMLLTNMSYTGVGNCEADNYEIIINNFKLYLNSKDAGECLDIGASSSHLEQNSNDNMDIGTSGTCKSKNPRSENRRTYKRVKHIPIP